MSSKRRQRRKQLNSCRHKIGYPTEARARSSAWHTTEWKRNAFGAAGLSQPINVHAYRCPQCPLWHVGAVR